MSEQCSVCKFSFMEEYIVTTFDNKLVCVHCIADYSKYLYQQQEKNMLRYMDNDICDCKEENK